MSGPRGGIRGAARAGAVVALLGLLAAGFANATTVDADLPDAAGRLLERELFLLHADRRPLALAHTEVDPASLVLRVGGDLWRAGEDFRLKARSGLIVPLRPWSPEGSVVAVADYRFMPGPGEARLGLRPMTPPPMPSGDARAPAAAKPLESWDLDTTGNLDVRGSKAVYVSSGTRREMTVDQNLRLNVSGQLTRDIFVRAVLTDDNLPVVPEGNTEELQDIDKVLVEIEASDWRATLGDFVASRSGTRYGNYRRKLQGFSLDAHPGDLRAEALFGSPRGRYRTLELRGEESNQGPYFLGGGESGLNLFIVAGSERVTVDGEVLTRGSDHDYIVDYVRGSVTFTFKRLITTDSLIVVEFEEGEGPYSRSVVGGGGGKAFTIGSTAVAVGVRMTRERDDSSRLRTGELSPEDEAVLAAAGDDPLAAIASGAVAVTAGTGDYDRVEVGDEEHFEFATEGGDWSVSFFYAGAGQGDYDLENLTEAGVRVFVWRGEDLGSYRVGRQLSLPDSQSLVTMTADVGDTSGAGLHAEWHQSSRDLNTLSDGGDEDNQGHAAYVEARSGRIGFGGGDLTTRAAWQRRGDRFAPFLVARTIHDYAGWGLDDRARRDGFLDERDAELTGEVAWRTGGTGRTLTIRGNLGSLDHGSDLSANRVTGAGTWEWAGGRGQHAWNRATSRDTVDPLDIERQDHDHQMRWKVGPVVPRMGWKRGTWTDAAIGGGAARGYRLEQLNAGMGSAPGRSWRWDLGFTRGLADSLREQTWEHERDSRTWQGSLMTPRVAGVRAVADATVREVRRPDGEDETTRLGRLELGAAWPGLGSDWSLSYGVDNSRTEVLARQIVFVGINEGRYDEAGNYVGEGRGDYDLLLAGTDELVATTAVKADLTWRQDFARLGKDRFWGAWQSQTRVGVDSRSRTDDVGALLRLDPGQIFNDGNTVLGRVDLGEEITLLRHLRTWDLRWRFDYSEVMDRQYAQGREDRLRREHSATLTWNPNATMSLTFRGGQADDRRDTDAEVNPTQRAYDTLTRNIETEGSWRPVAGSRLALSVEYLTRDDGVSGVAQTESAVKPSLRWRLARAWSVQSELRLADVQSDEPAGSLRPYFFPTPGTEVETSARVGWDPSRNLTFALVWFGRKPGGRTWQHDLRLESTARF